MPPLSPSDFAARVRAKYPGAYDDVSDQDLAAKVVAAHPEYSDMVASSQPSTPAEARVANVIAAKGGEWTGSRGVIPQADFNEAHRNRQAGTAPGSIGDFVEPTGVERLRSGAAALAGGTVGLVGGMIAQPIDAAMDDLTFGPIRRVIRGDSGFTRPQPLAQAVGRAVGEGQQQIRSELGVRPAAMTDVQDALVEQVPAALLSAHAIKGVLSPAELRMENVLRAKGVEVPESSPPSAPAETTSSAPSGPETSAKPESSPPAKAAEPLTPEQVLAMDTERRAATKGSYAQHISPLDEMDTEPGERYPIEDYFDKNSPPESLARGKAIYDGFAKWREAARAVYGDTITLARYGSERPERTVLHWSDPSDPDFTSGAHATEGGKARNLITREVPIDDVVAAPDYGVGKRQEFLVINRKSPGAIIPEESARSSTSTEAPKQEEAPQQSNEMRIVPKPEDVSAVAKKLAPVKEIMEGINPAGASEGAAKAADILRDSKAEIANDATVERYRNRDVVKAFEQAGDQKNTESISNYETTGRFMKGEAFPDQAAADAYSTMYKATTDAAHQSLQETYGDDRVGYVDNYVRRAFKFGTEADAQKATGVLSNYVGSLSASKSPLQGRVLSVPLDDALTQMRAAGIDVKPATTNPELLRQWTVENANQARVYKQAWTDAKSGKLIQFVAQGDRVPQGMTRLNDRVAQVFRPTEEGPVRTGQYFAEPGVARIFNNAISEGLGGSPTFRAIRAMNNAYNQMQLGLSAFHLTGTAINAGISDLSLGLQQIIQGDVASGAKSIGRAAVPSYSFVRDMVNGREFINDLVRDDPAARKVLDEKLNPAGGRLGIEQSYRNAAYENMVNAWSNRRYIRALGNLPLAVVQKIASPLMEYAIPRVKIGAFLDLADVNRQKLPADATPTQVQRAYEQAWDSIDNRFGQIVHDNLFWNRTAADLAQVSTRSVGWNLGTIRELGGGALDVARGKVSPRVLYSFSLALYSGMIGAFYQYLHTGKAPGELKDYYYPQNGLTDNHGRPDRVALPTYSKDVYAYSTHPLVTVEHKASPLLSMMFDLGTNRDYFGDMIRNPEDPAARQWLQVGQYALKQARPFSIQQAANTAAEGAPLQAGEQFLGFTKAPGEIRQNQEQADAFKEARRLRNENAMRAAAAKHGG